MIVRVINLIICLIGVDLSLAINDNYTFTYAMAHQCSEHIAEHGYSYDTFYRIDDSLFRFTKITVEDKDPAYFEMHIAIQAASNGHILLASKEYPGPTDPVYEIVVGGGGNRFTELRLNLKKNAKSSAKTPKILSPIQFTAFYIKIQSDGLVEFGKEGDELPLLSYYNPHSLPIRYFSFASWTGVEAKFLYDCPGPDDLIGSVPKSEEIERQLTNAAELKRSLLMSRLPSIPPANSVNVKLGIVVSHVTFDARTTKMTTHLGVVMSWTDDSLAWNPTKFNGTTSIKFRQGQIWSPKFFVMNSDSIEVMDGWNSDLITTVYSGESTFHFQTEVASWCTADVEETIKWPHDGYSCMLIIEPFQVHEKIILDRIEEDDNKYDVIKHLDTKIPSGSWNVECEARVYNAEIWNGILNEGSDNITHQSDRFTIMMDLTRKATTHNIAFYIPLLALITFVLLSICGEPLSPMREWFYCGCVVTVCVFLTFIDNLVPTHSVPSILIFYTTVMYGVILALWLHVLLLTPLAEKLGKTRIVQIIFTFGLLRLVFGLPPVKISLSEYQRQDDDDDEENTRPNHFEEMESDNVKVYGDPKEMALVMDKLMLVVFSITVASMLAKHY